MYSFLQQRCSFTQSPPKECIVMVGLPARGKSYMAKILCRYLNWNGHPTKIFNVGAHRRKNVGSSNCKADFFDPHSVESSKIREKLAFEVLNEMIAWLDEPFSRIGIYDATNSTHGRRKLIAETLKTNNIRAFFIESICNDESLLSSNVKDQKVKSPDFEGVSEEEALKDFMNRIKNYEKVYEPIYEEELSYLKIFDAGKQYFINKMIGFYQPRIVYYLMNIHLKKRTIFLTRHGESEYDQENRIGGDSYLTVNGIKYSKMLGDFMKRKELDNLRVWTGKLKRTIDTADFVCAKRNEFKSLDEVDVGTFDGISKQTIINEHNEEYMDRRRDKLHYKYPRGESYTDVVNRLNTIILELERHMNTLVITHKAVSRCILAYFCDIPSHKIPYIDVPLHTLFAITPNSYGCDIDIYKFKMDGNILPKLNTYVKILNKNDENLRYSF